MNYKNNINKILSNYKQDVFGFIRLGACYSFLKDNNLEARRHELKSVMFLSMYKHSHLSWLIETDFSNLKDLVNNPIYKSYKISKKTGGLRAIDSPDENLKKVQRSLNSYLQSYYLCIKPNSVHGFVPKFSHFEKRINIVENAKAHIGKKYVLNLDLKDFFDGI